MSSQTSQTKSNPKTTGMLCRAIGSVMYPLMALSEYEYGIVDLNEGLELLTIFEVLWCYDFMWSFREGDSDGHTTVLTGYIPLNWCAV